MANIRLKELMEANIDPKLTARSKETGKLVYFKTPQAKDKAMKAGTHEDPKAKKGGEPKAAVKPNDMFGGDYAKDRGAKAAPKDDTDWISNLDSIDTSDVKGKADPNADSFTHDDVFGATFKDPQTGKTTTVGDAYEKEDNSPAYKKAFAYVSKFDPDKEAVVGTQAYSDLDKKAKSSSKLTSMLPKVEPTPKIVGNWKSADEDGRMSSDAADDVRNYLNDVLGVDGMAEVDFGSGNIAYGLSDSENSIYVGRENGTYNVSYEGPSVDIDTINKSYKSFKNPKDALTYAGKLAQANRKGLEQKYTDAADGPKINGKDQTTPNRMFDKKKPFDPKEIEKDVTDMLKSDGYEVEHQWGTTDYFLNISKKDKNGKEVERYTVKKDPKTGMADVWDAVAKQWVVEGEPSISRLYDTIGQIPYFRED
jgi:hypothetical protein